VRGEGIGLATSATITASSATTTITTASATTTVATTATTATISTTVVTSATVATTSTATTTVTATVIVGAFADRGFWSDFDRPCTGSFESCDQFGFVGDGFCEHGRRGTNATQSLASLAATDRLQAKVITSFDSEVVDQRGHVAVLSLDAGQTIEFKQTIAGGMVYVEFVGMCRDQHTTSALGCLVHIFKRKHILTSAERRQKTIGFNVFGVGAKQKVDASVGFAFQANQHEGIVYFPKFF
jgi:hypothetical protein